MSKNRTEAEKALCESLILYRRMSSYLSHDCVSEISKISTYMQLIEYSQKTVLEENQGLAEIHQKLREICARLVEKVESIYMENKYMIPFVWVASKHKEWRSYPRTFLLRHMAVVQIFENVEQLLKAGTQFRPTFLIIEEGFAPDLKQSLSALHSKLFSTIKVEENQFSPTDENFDFILSKLKEDPSSVSEDLQKT